jgi:hypothetical protein
MTEAASMLAPRVPERQDGGSGGGETRVAVAAARSGQDTPPPIAEIHLTHRFLTLYPYEARSGPPAPCPEIPPAFPYSGLQAGMFGPEISAC